MKGQTTGTGVINIKCETEGFDEAIEDVEALAKAYDGLPAQVNIRGCNNCTFNIYTSSERKEELDRY